MGYCSSCGLPVPDGQSVCSMCYGDPYYGKDGYYLDWLRKQEEYEDYQRWLEGQDEQEYIDELSRFVDENMK